MSRPRPTPVRLSELTPGQSGDFFALLVERSKGLTRDGKPFYTCRFRDAGRMASCMVWADSPLYDDCELHWRDGQFYKVRGLYTEHERYGAQIEIQMIRPIRDEDEAEGFNPDDFVEHSRHDREQMFVELRALVEANIADEPLRGLVLTLLDRHAGPLRKLPATQGKLYPFLGGLLEHTLSVTRSCLALADRYIAYYPELKPPLNRDLITAGAVLHDIGRVLEFGDAAVTAPPTIPGRLFGHLFLGRDLVRDTARELGNIDPELVLLLEHLLVSHLNLPEWGSPRLPLIPEALILHHADDLDAKLEMYVRCLTRDQADSPFTDRDPVLNRQLFKGRTR
jgi:3'-5' exoribonuclease